MGIGASPLPSLTRFRLIYLDSGSPDLNRTESKTKREQEQKANSQSESREILRINLPYVFHCLFSLLLAIHRCSFLLCLWLSSMAFGSWNGTKERRNDLPFQDDGPASH
uniref:Uncharacterized protein n=1 Tax=Utricularia reniformis TaxID=192314 RepID=A0A1Y0B1B8_9LAMI|nr:hypothetical protein AEK19_MT0985 [Utricularia reniformis]ART31210.1 hypothetical protein AEK19_MT0985 [Utricularia reniformis]